MATRAGPATNHWQTNLFPSQQECNGEEIILDYKIIYPAVKYGQKKSQDVAKKVKGLMAHATLWMLIYTVEAEMIGPPPDVLAKHTLHQKAQITKPGYFQ